MAKFIPKVVLIGEEYEIPYDIGTDMQIIGKLEIKRNDDGIFFLSMADRFLWKL